MPRVSPEGLFSGHLAFKALLETCSCQVGGIHRLQFRETASVPVGLRRLTWWTQRSLFSASVSAFVGRGGSQGFSRLSAPVILQFKAKAGRRALIIAVCIAYGSDVSVFVYVRREGGILYIFSFLEKGHLSLPFGPHSGGWQAGRKAQARDRRAGSCGTICRLLRVPAGPWCRGWTGNNSHQILGAVPECGPSFFILMPTSRPVSP